MKYKIVITFILITLAFLSPVTVFAASTMNCGNSGNDPLNYDYTNSFQKCPPTIGIIGKVVITIVSILLALSTMVFFIMLIIQGTIYMTSQGDPEKVDKATKSMLVSMIGFGLVFGSFIILDIIITSTGATSSNFYIDQNGIHFNPITTIIPT